uniref:Uncharacterized protein n=1 Tax=Oryza nivara TaxID=4536 RepID=A0A0E0IJT9_ORYNI
MEFYFILDKLLVRTDMQRYCKGSISYIGHVVQNSGTNERPSISASRLEALLPIHLQLLFFLAKEFVHLIPTTFHGDLTSKRVNTTLPVSNVSTKDQHNASTIIVITQVPFHLCLLQDEKLEGHWHFGTACNWQNDVFVLYEI